MPLLRAALLSIGDLADRRLIRILVRSLLITLAVFAALAVLLGWALAGTDPCGWVGLGAYRLDPLSGGLSGVVITLVATWLLFPAVALGVISAYMDAVIAVVEARHYPDAAATARPIGIGRGALLGLRSTPRLLAYNLIALPFYIVLLITGIGTVALFILVNGFALASDLGEMVAGRHGEALYRREWLRSTRATRALTGAAIAALFLVPIANLNAPILAAAMATHLLYTSDRAVSRRP